jgi:hypothetical protein
MPGAAIRGRWHSLTAGRSPSRLTLAATVFFWMASALSWTLSCLRVDHRFGSGMGRDLVTVWRAERVFAHGGQPYSLVATGHRVYLYPPSSLLVLRPVALLSVHETQIPVSSPLRHWPGRR